LGKCVSENNPIFLLHDILEEVKDDFDYEVVPVLLEGVRKSQKNIGKNIEGILISSNFYVENLVVTRSMPSQKRSLRNHPGPSRSTLSSPMNYWRDNRMSNVLKDAALKAVVLSHCKPARNNLFKEYYDLQTEEPISLDALTRRVKKRFADIDKASVNGTSSLLNPKVLIYRSGHHMFL